MARWLWSSKGQWTPLVGLNADQPEDDERDVDSVQREGERGKGRDVKEGDTQGRGEKKRERAKCAHGQDRGTHSPLSEGYI
jgi:hypothetical protein